MPSEAKHILAKDQADRNALLAVVEQFEGLESRDCDLELPVVQILADFQRLF